jgi:predicted AlkP superfamily pyrophosphatase or phosphodiesterase
MAFRKRRKGDRMPGRGAVVIGIDGVRHDSLLAADTPHLDALAARGMVTSFTVGDEAPVNSGPLWASVATGVHPSFHGVYDNSLAGNRLAAFPDFLHALSTTDRQLRTYLATSWRPLATRVFRPADRTVSLHGDVVGYDEADRAVATDARQVFERGGVDAAFLHLGEPDSVAHRHGVGPAYLDAIARADAYVGMIVKPLLAGSREWTIIVVTDHGQVDSGGHGGRSPEETTAWLAAAGPGITARPASHVDVFPTVFSALGLRPHSGWGLAGSPLQTLPDSSSAVDAG